MRRLAVAAAVAGALVLGGAASQPAALTWAPLEGGGSAQLSADGAPATSAARPMARRRGPSLYGIAGPRPVGLVRVDAATLRPLPGRRVPLAAHTSAWSFS